MKIADATYGLWNIIVPTCPYCGYYHEHIPETTPDKKIDQGKSRQAPCGSGLYILNFNRDPSTDEVKN